MMKFHISILALSLCALAPISAKAQTDASGQASASAQGQTSTKTTVLPGKDDTTVILRPEGQPQAVIDVNQDILGKSAKKANDASRDAAADAKQEVHPNADAGTKAAASEEDKSSSGKTANDDPKTLDKAQTTGSNSAGSAGGDCIKESWGAGKSQDKSADQPQANSGKKCD